MMFSEVRVYQYGDDIRNIDWNVTARFHHPFIKTFEEERELTVMLMIDVSGSREFGTTQNLKKSIITEIAAVLSFSAIQNNDFSELARRAAPLAEPAGECGFRSLCFLFGAAHDCKASLLSYEAPFGIGYAVAAWLP